MERHSRSQLRRVTAAGSFLILTTMFFASSAMAAEKAKIILGINWPPYALWNVIKEKNLAPDLDLEIVQMDDPLRAHNMLAAGQVDLVMNTIDYAPIIVEQNMPIKLVSFANLDYGSSQILVGPGIKSQTDLRGKKIGAFDGYISQLMMVLWLKEGGVGTDEVTWVNLTPEQAGAAMLSGDVAAAYTWDPWAGQILQRLKGSQSISNAKQDFWLKTALLADSIFMNADFVHERRDVALALMRAYFDGVSWWKKNTAEGNAIIAKAVGYPIPDVEWVMGKDGTSQDGALRMYNFIEAARFCGVAPGELPHGQVNGQIWRVFSLTNEAWLAVGINEAKVPAARTVDCSLLRELYESGYAGQPDPNY